MRLSVLDPETIVSRPDDWDIKVECAPAVSLSKEDKKWVHEAIARTSTEKQVGSVPQTTVDTNVKLAGLGLGRWLTIIGMIVGLVVSIFQGGEWVGSVNTNMANLNLRMARIESSIDKLTATIDPIEALQDIESIPSDQIPALLPVLHEGLRKANPSDPGYWQATLRFIQLASARNAPVGVPPPGSTANLTYANNRIYGFENAGPNVKPFGDLRQVVIVLDDGDLLNFTCERCRVIFTENAVRMKNVRFVDCVFEVRDSVDLDTPPSYMRQATEQILAGPIESVHIQRAV